MKLAEALSERKALLGKMVSLKKQSAEQFKVTESMIADKEATITIISLLQTLTVRLGTLIDNINNTNNKCLIEYGNGEMSIMTAIANKDARTILLTTLEGLKDEVLSGSLYRSENTPHSLDIQFLNKEIADLKEEIRELDLKIQEANWKYDLID